ncbi:hypothetical protein L9F63_001291 [Diploptera punctata]|uniref:Large ribosomal subunit protein bL9m n=1 Tax=Diploptera punctata TaxID=6984 RepID=A0AAD8A3X0_DIPPU|nr:hypothetical protein L9F63_001291 [Diploptera punctata]
MWGHLQILGRALKASNLLTLSNQNIYQQLRTTFILKRRSPPGLYKKWQTHGSKRLKARHFIYDLVEDTNLRKNEDLEVILTDYVKGVGNPGDKIKMKENFVYNNFLLPGLAVYASEQNVEKFGKNIGIEEKLKFSSPYVQDTMKYLSDITVKILMNKEVAWIIQPWHVRSSFRRAGIHVPEDAIKLPEEQIAGPNLDLEGKYFEVIVTINNRETVPVKCVIHHWSTVQSEKLPPKDDVELPLIPVFAQISEPPTVT